MVDNGKSIKNRILVVRVFAAVLILSGLAVVVYGVFGYDEREAKAERIDGLWKQMSVLSFRQSSTLNSEQNEQVRKLNEQYLAEVAGTIGKGAATSFLIEKIGSGIFVAISGILLLSVIRQANASNESKTQRNDDSDSTQAQ